MYAMTCTRPDIAYAVSMLSRRTSNYSEGDWQAAKRVLKYLNCTKTLGILYESDKNASLEVYVDAGDGSTKDWQGVTLGYFIKLAGGAVSWKSSKAQKATLSSAEFML